MGFAVTCHDDGWTSKTYDTREEAERRLKWMTSQRPPVVCEATHEVIELEDE